MHKQEAQGGQDAREQNDSQKVVRRAIKARQRRTFESICTVMTIAGAWAVSELLLPGGIGQNAPIEIKIQIISAVVASGLMKACLWMERTSTNRELDAISMRGELERVLNEAIEKSPDQERAIRRLANQYGVPLGRFAATNDSDSAKGD